MDSTIRLTLKEEKEKLEEQLANVPASQERLKVNFWFFKGPSKPIGFDCFYFINIYLFSLQALCRELGEDSSIVNTTKEVTAASWEEL